LSAPMNKFMRMVVGIPEGLKILVFLTISLTYFESSFSADEIDLLASKDWKRFDENEILKLKTLSRPRHRSFAKLRNSNK